MAVCPFGLIEMRKRSLLKAAPILANRIGGHLCDREHGRHCADDPTQKEARSRAETETAKRRHPAIKAECATLRQSPGAAGSDVPGIRFWALREPCRGRREPIHALSGSDMESPVGCEVSSTYLIPRVYPEA
jgi:hypothetical protein